MITADDIQGPFICYRSDVLLWIWHAGLNMTGAHCCLHITDDFGRLVMASNDQLQITLKA